MTRLCQKCGGPIPQGKNYLTKKFCCRPCYNASKPYTPERRATAFWGRVDKSGGPDACWPWLGAITTHGYGCVQTGNRRVMGAHKVAYLMSKGDVPDGYEIMHSCDNRPCCNPSHLSIGTKQDNTDDKMRKGRGLTGMDWYAHRKLKPEHVQEIRSLRGVEQSGSLAKRFGVEQPHIINIWNRRVWKNVP